MYVMARLRTIHATLDTGAVIGDTLDVIGCLPTIDSTGLIAITLRPRRTRNLAGVRICYLVLGIEVSGCKGNCHWASL